MENPEVTAWNDALEALCEEFPYVGKPTRYLNDEEAEQNALAGRVRGAAKGLRKSPKH